MEHLSWLLLTHTIIPYIMNEQKKAEFDNVTQKGKSIIMIQKDNNYDV